MNRTKLEFKIISTENYLTAFDCSIYNPDIPVTNPTLGIVPPNFSTRYTKTYVVDGKTPITGKDIFGSECPLTDGVYQLDFSVCPNEEVFIKINYLRSYNLAKKILTFDSKDDCENLKDILYLESASELIKGDCEDYERGVLIFNTLCKKYGM